MARFVDIEGLSVDVNMIEAYKLQDYANKKYCVAITTKDGRVHSTTPVTSREKVQIQFQKVRDQVDKYTKPPASHGAHT